MAKSSDYNTPLDLPDALVPDGGLTGQVLKKISDTDQDVDWQDEQEIPEVEVETPLQATQLPSNCDQIGAYRSGGVVLSDNTLRLWGNGGLNRLGLGTQLDNQNVAVAPALPKLSSPIKKFLRRNANILLLENGEVWVWGYNGQGQLGTGNTANVQVPTQIMIGINVVDVSISRSNWDEAHTLFLTDTGAVYACGYNAYGQLGDGSTTQRTTPVLIAGTYKHIEAVCSRFGNSFAIGTDNNLYSWGHGDIYSQLGLGNSNVTTNTPTLVTLPTTVAKVVSTRDTTSTLTSTRGHTLCLLTDGRVFSWGYNGDGQLGNGNTTTQLSPYEITSLGSDNKDIFIGGGYSGTSGIIKNDESVLVWGHNGFGQLGQGSTTDISTPTALTVNGTVKKAIFIGSLSYTSLVLLYEDGTVDVCGYNLRGTLGVGDKINKTVLQQLPLNGFVVDVCAVGTSTEVSLAILTDTGRYYQTGGAYNYQNIGTEVDQVTPKVYQFA